MTRRVRSAVLRFADAPDQTVQFQLKHYVRKSKSDSRMRFTASRTFTIHNVDLDTAEQVLKEAFTTKAVQTNRQDR